jgi:galactokinase
MGEHVDYNDGFVMPAAINHGIWFAIAKNDTPRARFFAADLDDYLLVDINDIQPQEGWKNYVLGVIHVLQENNLPVQGFDCAFGGNLPIGSGLSSSAAVECGLIFALNEIFQLGQDRKTLALMAQRAEHTFAGVKCGIMDQYASLMGKAGNVLLLDCKTIEHQYLPFELQDHVLVLLNSKVQHALAGGEYNVRRMQCTEGLDLIKQHEPSVKTFRDVSRNMLSKYELQMDPTVYKRCRYVVNEIDRTLQAADLLLQNNIEAFGKRMYETHQGLSKGFGVSCDELDFLVSEAAALQVTGARLMGGGFGGCTINIIRKEDRHQSISKIVSAYDEKFGTQPGIIEIDIANGTHEI